jgi:hypothetical protein
VRTSRSTVVAPQPASAGDTHHQVHQQPAFRRPAAPPAGTAAHLKLMVCTVAVPAYSAAVQLKVRSSISSQISMDTSRGTPEGTSAVRRVRHDSARRIATQAQLVQAMCVRGLA